MKRFLMVPFVVLGALLLMAQVSSNDAAAPVTRGETSTTGNVTYYVDPVRGRDTYHCLYPTTACQTMAGLCGKLPRRIWHDVTVEADGGAYSSGCLLDDIRVGTGPGRTAPGSILIRAPLSAWTATSGVAQGYPSDQEDGGDMVLDYPGGWDDGGVVGLAVEITAGTNAGLTREISANTCCTITFGTAWPANPDGTSYFKIRDWGAVFTGNQSQLWTAGGGSTTGNGAAWLVNLGGPSSVDSAASKPALTLRGFKFGVGVDAGVAIQSGSVALDLVSFSGSGGPPVEMLGPTASVTAARAVGYSVTKANEKASAVDFPAILAGACNDQTVVAAGFNPGIPLSCWYPPATLITASPSCLSEDAGTVSWRLCNANQDGGTIDPASGSYGAARPW